MSELLYDGHSIVLPTKLTNVTSCAGFSIRSRVNYFVYRMKPSNIQHSLAFDIGVYVNHQHESCKHLFLSNVLDVSCIAGLTTFVAINSSTLSSINIHVLKKYSTHVEQMIQLYNTRNNVNIIGVEHGDKIDFGCSDNSNTLVHVHVVNDIVGYSVVSEKSKMKSEYAKKFQLIAKDKNQREQFLKDYSSECYETLTTYHFTYYYYVLNKSCINNSWITDAKLLVTACPSSIQNVLNWRSKTMNTEFMEFSECIRLFKGDVLCLATAPESMVINGYCNLAVFLYSRIPPEQVHKLIFVPHRDTKYSIEPKNETHPEMKLSDDTPFPEYSIEKLDESEYELREFVGFIGSQIKKRREEWSKKYPEGIELAYVIPKAAYNELMNISNDNVAPTEFNRDSSDKVIISRKSAFLIFEDAYVHFFKTCPQVVEWLSKTACNIYDTELANVTSNYDYEIQHDETATHIQDIAVRRALKRSNISFQGNRLVQVRGFRSEAYALNPCQTEFHRPEWICKPEVELEFMLSGSIESFWQSNKVIVTRKKHSKAQ
jgi:hypothetical protein